VAPAEHWDQGDREVQADPVVLVDLVELVDQEVRGDQQQLVVQVELAAVAVVVVVVPHQEEKQTHPPQAVVVVAVQGLSVELVVLPALILVIIQEVPVARELQTLVARAGHGAARVEDWV